MTRNLPTEQNLKERWDRFFQAFSDDEFSPSDFDKGNEETVDELDPINDVIADSKRIGVYYFMDERKHVLYVGSADVAFGNRFWAHYKKIKDDRNKYGWERATYFRSRPLRQAIESDKRRYARALEAYLIVTLSPPLNRRV